MITGIYKLTNIITGSTRIGSADNILKRFSTYKSEFKKGKTYSVMQEDYNLYGADSFTYEIIEECSHEDSFKREQFWADIYKETNLYNHNKVVNTTRKVLTEEQKELKKVNRSRATSGEKNGNCSKLTEQKASEILWIKNNTPMKQREIAEMYEITSNLVSRIGRDRWINVIAKQPFWLTIENVEFENTGMLLNSESKISI